MGETQRLMGQLQGNVNPPESLRQQLEALVKAARAIEFDNPEVNQAVELYEEIMARIHTREDLVAGTKEHNETKLRNALAEAKRLGFDMGEASVVAAQNELARIEEENVILKDIRTALSLLSDPEETPDLSYSAPTLN